LTQRSRYAAELAASRLASHVAYRLVCLFAPANVIRHPVALATAAAFLGTISVAGTVTIRHRHEDVGRPIVSVYQLPHIYDKLFIAATASGEQLFRRRQQRLPKRQQTTQ